MFKTIITAVVLATAAVAAQAKTVQFAGSDYHWNDFNEVHVEYVNGTKIRVLEDADKYALVVEGSVVLGLANKLDEMLKEIDKANEARGYIYVPTVYLHSNGGSAAEGIKAGKVLRKHQAQTVVSGDMVCWSACSDMFIGGKYRKITSEGVIGLHAPYTTGKFGTSTCVTQNHPDAKIFTDYAKLMLDARTADIYNMWSFKCNVNGGKEVTAGQYWIQSK